MKTYEKELNNGAVITITVEDNELYCHTITVSKGGKKIIGSEQNFVRDNIIFTDRSGVKFTRIDGTPVRFADPSAWDFIRETIRDIRATRKVTRSAVRNAEDVLAQAGAQDKILTNAQVERRYRDYNRAMNEGGEGFIPDLKLGVTVEQVESAKRTLEKAQKNGIIE